MTVPEEPKSQTKRQVKAFRFSSVALGSALIDWLIFTALVFTGVRPLHAQMTARVAGGIFSFVNNKFWSFEARDHKHVTREGRRFLLLYMVSYLISIWIFHGLTDVIDLSPFLSKVIADGSVFVFNFFVMDHYVFEEKRSLRAFLMRRLRGLLNRD